MTPQQIIWLARSLAGLPKETEWVEFKLNNADPQKIGENISGLANSAALHRKNQGYIVWGVEDVGHRIVGTAFDPRREKVKGQELENWLVTQLTPPIDVRIHEGDIDGCRIVVFEIQPAMNMPVQFRGVEYIRIGGYTKNLRDHPEKERALWALFSEVPFEKGTAARDVSSDDVLAMIDYPAYFQATRQSLPDNRDGILRRLATESLIVDRGQGRFDVASLGGILFARNLNAFDRLSRKALRVIIYEGKNRVRTVREQAGVKGYAVGYEGAIEFINSHLPKNEQIGQALRREVRLYPEIAIRELVANAIIHQDFNMTGTGPMVEIFADRIEITNPGEPLVDTMRFIDTPPQS